MTPLTKAMRNELARDPELTALLGSSATWPTWIFLDEPEVKFENSQKCLIVVSTYDDMWAQMNMHNTQEFPTVVIDVWADPTRNPDKSVKVKDAEEKINAVGKLIMKHFHTVNMSRPGGGMLQWGTQTQIDNGTGIWVSGSHFIDGPRTNRVSNVEGALMGSYRYGVNLIS